MIGKLLASGQLGKLATFVSPAFFDVMPARPLWAKAHALWSASRDREAFRHAVAECAAMLASKLPGIQLATSGAGTQAASASRGQRPAQEEGTRSARASLVTQLFFCQLFHDGATLLDLRASSFADGPDKLSWHPAPWLNVWAAEFIGPLRDVYRGFYGDDDERFRRGLAALSLAHSEDLFRAYFAGGQREVTFRTREFVSTFHQIFVRCKQEGRVLHPDFLALGIYLAALYDHLEELGSPVDVARAFSLSVGTSTARHEALHG